MAEPTVENVLCKACGADIREGALFCYGCGKSVAERSKSLQMPKPEPGLARDRDPSPRATAINIPRPDLSPLEIPDEGKTETIPAAKNGLKTRTASSLRRRAKSVNGSRVEVSWVKPEGPPLLFYVVTLAVGIAAVLLVAAALYLR